MKTISITIDEALDERVSAEAKRRGMSKSELVRKSLTETLPPDQRPGQPLTGNPWIDLAGFASYDTKGEHHDDIVYGS